MESYRNILIQSLVRYKELFSKITELVNLANNNDHAAMTVSIENYRDTLRVAQELDSALATISSEDNIRSNISLWNERKTLMQTILDYHTKMLPHLESIMAIQQSDIENIKRGLRGVSGYQTGGRDTGGLIKESY